MSEEDDDWIDAYWVLFDALWAVECAIIQRFIALRQQARVNDFDTAENIIDEVLEQLGQKRTSLIVSIFHITGPMMPSTALLESLATTLLEWDKDLDDFLCRQDSLLQHRRSRRPSPTVNPSYGKRMSGLAPYFDVALASFSDWLSERKSKDSPISVERVNVKAHFMEDTVKEWIQRITSPNAKAIIQGTNEPLLPLYVVDCPKLHVIPKKWLAEQLRWWDKFAYENIQDGSPIVSWKEGVQCSGCVSGEKIKCARLIEPLQQALTNSGVLQQDYYSSSQYSVDGSASYGATWSSAESHSTSDGGSGGVSLPLHTTMPVSVPTLGSYSGSDMKRKKSTERQLPRYIESPISPFIELPASRLLRSHGSCK